MYRLLNSLSKTKSPRSVAGMRDLDSSRRRRDKNVRGPSSREIAAPHDPSVLLGRPRAVKRLFLVRGDVGEREFLERLAAQADQLRLFGGLLDRPAVLQHALGEPYRADAVRRTAMHVCRLVGL